MPSLNFKRQFADPVRTGKKRQTIRRIRKYQILPGATLTLYTDQRKPTCELLLETHCTSVRPIVRRGPMDWAYREHGHDLELSRLDLTQLAAADGFDSVEAFDGFFRDQYGDGPLEDLVLVKWAYPRG